MSKDFEPQPQVGVIMGSESDLEVMQHAALTLEEFEVPHEVRVISAHRTPEKMALYGKEAVRRGLKVIIAGAGGSAHLPGEVASYTTLPVLGVAVESKPDPLSSAIGSMIRMPKGVPLAFMGVNEAGAVNAALESIRVLSSHFGDTTIIRDYAWRMSRDIEEIDEALRVKGMKAFQAERRRQEEESQTG